MKSYAKRPGITASVRASQALGSEGKQSNAAVISSEVKQSALCDRMDESPITQGQLSTQEAADSSANVQGLRALQRMVDDKIIPVQQKNGDDAGQQENFIVAKASNKNSNGLPDHLRAGIEHLSGISMDHVKVHRNSNEPGKIGADAFAQGHTIHLGPGQEKHLPHEAWHVVQQAQGKVKPTRWAQGVEINDDPALEIAATEMGQKAQRFSPRTPQILEQSIAPQSTQNYNSPLQMVKGIARPQWTKDVKNTIKLTKGEHRRHVVMSSRMREAIWAYHMATGLTDAQKLARRQDLQVFIGESSTLRTEMAKATANTHNSMGNLFAGKGGENTAIGFAYRPLSLLAASIPDPLDSADKIRSAVTKWHNQGIFAFALAHKKTIGQVISNWLDDPSNHDNNLGVIASAIEDFAFTCSFDMAYEVSEDAVEIDKFPGHINAVGQANLFKVATNIEEIINNPKADKLDLYGNSCLGDLMAVAYHY